MSAIAHITVYRPTGQPGVGPAEKNEGGQVSLPAFEG